ncbi:MAG: 3-deoxy-manno-octulosonate cytidylyltransferase [Bacteroidota bacterium]
MRCVAIIPARFASTRFPGKPLAEIAGKSILQRVIEQAQKVSSLSDIWVTTDNDQIQSHVESLGIKVFRTSPLCESGTERIIELTPIVIEHGFDAVLNIQGDEPFIHPETIEAVVKAIETNNIVTACTPLQTDEEISDPNRVKVTINTLGNALYFSRSPIPFSRNPYNTYKKHLGIYGFSLDALKKIAHLEPHELELAESLEQLRWLANDIPIRVVETKLDSLGIDTPLDLENAKKLYFQE